MRGKKNGFAGKTLQTRNILVGATGLEPATPCSQSRCATKLRHTPYAADKNGQEKQRNTLIFYLLLYLRFAFT